MLAEGAAVAAGALGLWAGWIEPRSLGITRISATIPGLAAPVRAVAIGDLQPWRHHWPAARLRAAFARAAAERPDILFWLGDYWNAPTKELARALALAPALRRLHDRAQTPMAAIAAEMGRLTAPMGAFAVLGNHDWAWSGEAVAEALRAAGVTPLIGERAEAVHPATGARLTVIGLDDESSGRPHGWERLRPPPGAPAVLLTHAPDVWADIPDAPALTLAGHSHGGQIAPWPIGPTVLPRFARRHPYGWYARAGARLFVTRGVGASGPPARLGAPPEIVVIDLAPGALPPRAPPR
jgi:predicted MPP superfamily phosphohydrolase